MKYKCQHCGKKIIIPEGAAGKKGVCPHCRNSFYVPDNITEHQAAHIINDKSSDKSSHRETFDRPINERIKPRYFDISQTDIWSYYNQYIQNIILKGRPDEICEKHIGFWWRCFQYIIDLFPICFLGLLLYRPINRFMEFFEPHRSIILIAEIMLVLIVLVSLLLYWTLLESSQFQGSIGKMLLGFKVTDLHYQPISFKTAFIRNLLKLMQFIPPFTLLFIYLMFHPQKQGIHDRFAGTFVVLQEPGMIWYYERRWVVLWLLIFLPFGLAFFLY